jgi:hypothetical protein
MIREKRSQEPESRSQEALGCGMQGTDGKPATFRSNLTISKSVNRSLRLPR